MEWTRCVDQGSPHYCTVWRSQFPGPLQKWISYSLDCPCACAPVVSALRGGIQKIPSAVVEDMFAALLSAVPTIFGCSNGPSSMLLGSEKGRKLGRDRLYHVLWVGVEGPVGSRRRGCHRYPSPPQGQKCGLSEFLLGMCLAHPFCVHVPVSG